MKLSLKLKAALLVSLLVLSISTLAIVSSRRLFMQTIREQYTIRAKDVAGTLAVTLPPEKVRRVRDEILKIYHSKEEKVSNEYQGTPEHDAYVKDFLYIEEMQDYQDVRAQMRAIQDATDIRCAYLLYADTELANCIYVVDADYEFFCPPGTFDLFYEEDYSVIDHPEDGFAPMITNTEEYGWSVATGKPLYDGEEILCYACADIDMNDIVATANRDLRYLILAMIVFMLLTGLLGFWLVDHFIVRPVNILSQAADVYAKEQGIEKGDHFSCLLIRTGDEIENLADSMARMEKDMTRYIENLKQTTEALGSSRERERELDRLASIDQLTGVYNRRSFDEKIEELKKRVAEKQADFGLAAVDLNYLKLVNDTYGHEKGDLAIKGLAEMICSVFTGSGIYRLGGDEFAVILEGEDFERADELEAEFRRREIYITVSEDNGLKKKISAAFGYVAYDPEKDIYVEDVIKRADAMMYRDKREKKARGS